MISERTLRRWRRDALVTPKDVDLLLSSRLYIELQERILRLTQELLDQHLIRKG